MGFIRRLILDADSIPMVVPFVLTGMQEIMPVGASIPRIGKTKQHNEYQEENYMMQLLQGSMVDWELLGIESYLSVEDDSKPRQEILMPPIPDLPSTIAYQWLSENGFLIKDLGLYGPELLSFAARGLFMKRRAKEIYVDSWEGGPLMAWKQCLEANVLGQWNFC
ncbi:Tafazzin family protein [Quillaja saponaria]|uniref:Tafazzin family protein n=1 Tax=Quillaja saponaria TaxID=32244 RepID=A0AAD7Q1V3_QUISA|nr:Tafazzin family protein [Quillaja saponaria]